MNPYSENRNGNMITRTFSQNISENELVWHRDKADRIVKVLSETDWMLQFDNELPIKMNLNEEYYIPKESFHRVIKGNGDLVVEITETDFVEEGKKDACYHKVRSRYKVWPSAYASGALVKCRKVGAANWGNKSNESEEQVVLGSDKNTNSLIDKAHNAITKIKGKEYAPDVHEIQAWIDNYLKTNDVKLDELKEPIGEKWSEKYKRSIDCNNPKGFSQRAHCQGKKKRNENTTKNMYSYIKESLVFLAEITSDDAYEQYYKNIFHKDNPELDKAFYNKIVRLDPTFDENKSILNPYAKWLLKKNNVEILKKTKEEDFYKIKDDLTFFNEAKVKNLLPQDKKDINKFTIKTLADFVFGMGTNTSDLKSKTEKEKEIKQDIKKYDLPNWTIIVPKTEEASCAYGSGTRWCTAAKYNNQYSNYNKQGPLYILINKQDPSDKYQFHFESSQFMDPKDNPINLGEFISENDEIYNFFSNLFGDSQNFDFQICMDSIKNGNMETFDSFFTNKFTRDQKYDLLNEAFQSEYNSSDYYVLTHVLYNINYSDLAKDFKDDLLNVIENTFSYHYDDENYNLKYFIDLFGGFNSETIDDIVRRVNFKDMREIEKIFEIAQDYENGLDVLKDELLSQGIEINYDLIDTLEDLKRTFYYSANNKMYTSKIGRVKINKIEDLENGIINITFTPKDDKGEYINDKKETGNVDYRNIVKYLSMPQLDLKEAEIFEAKKTDYSKEKSQGLHGWFSRRGGEGSSGWVDCNTCRKDPETGRKKCKPCGRKEGENRKYPACRPTPASCGTPKKGKKWGKKANEGVENTEKSGIFEKNKIKSMLRETFGQDTAEPAVKPKPITKPAETEPIQPSRKDKPFLPIRETKPDPKAEN